jgi:hypothetical protein
MHVNGTSKAHVVQVVPVMEHDEDRYGGLLMIRRL